MAVDRVLLSLVEHGCKQFLRLGSAKRISKDLLPYSVFSEQIENGGGATLGKTALSKIGAARVVGTTCLATLLPAMDDQCFQITIIDEISQVTEPLSLLPISRARSSRLLLVGDPNQLPPQLVAPARAEGGGLERTLFSRLADLDYPVTLLRTQYRSVPLPPQPVAYLLP